VVVEELKKRLTAQVAKLKRYEDRQNQYLQSGVFETSQKNLRETMERKQERNNAIYRVKRVENYGMVSLNYIFSPQTVYIYFKIIKTLTYDLM
jgi:ASC-1-like (ASCH) protein